MNIASINSTSQTGTTYKNPNNKNSNVSFSDKLKEAVNDTDDKGYTALLNEINNEPEDDREEDMKLYDVLKYHGFDCKGHNLQWVKEYCGLVTFPPITVPGHVRKAYEDCMKSLPISEKEKGDITFRLAIEYQMYKEEKFGRGSYNEDMRNAINYLFKYNENHNNSNDIKIYENIKILLNNFMNSLN